MLLIREAVGNHEYCYFNVCFDIPSTEMKQHFICSVCKHLKVVINVSSLEYYG